VNHPRRHSVRLLIVAVRDGAAAVVMTVAAGAAIQRSVTLPAVAMAVAPAVLTWRARRALRASARNRVGARSEERVARTLAVLSDEGWGIRHGVDWPGPGDIDHVVIYGKLRFAVETKTARYNAAHLGRLRRQARWVGGRRGSAVAVLVLCRGRQVCRYDSGVLVVTIDELVGALRRHAV
jgi:hypothetical protein